MGTTRTAPPHFAGFAGECTATFWQLEEEEVNQNRRTLGPEGEEVPWPQGKSRIWLSPSAGSLSRWSALPSHAVFLSPFHRDCFPVCRFFFKPYLVSSGSPLLQATAPARAPLGPDGHPWAHVRSQPSPALSRRRPRAPVPSAISLGFRTELLGQDLVPRFLGPPSSVPGCRGRAAWDAEAPEPFGGHRGAAVRMGLTRGAQGRPRWSQARRWRIFGAHCAA